MNEEPKNGYLERSRERLEEARGRVRTTLGALIEDVELGIGMGQPQDTPAGALTPPPSLAPFLNAWAELWQTAGALNGALAVAEPGGAGC